MYELNRARLVGIGPRGARYSDVTLDLSGLGAPIASQNLFDTPVRRPAPFSLLLLENGGGKSVLLKLLFSVVLPGRRNTVGGASLEKFVLDGDTGHVALEWIHVTTGERLVTGKVYQRRSRSSSDKYPVAEAWYSFRPSTTLDLDELPVMLDDRRRRLEGFHEAVEEADREEAATELAWLGDDQGKWRRHLRERGIEPDLFDIQRRMNVDEGEAAKAFNYSSSKDFVDWLLTTVTDPKDAASVADTFSQWAVNLADREQMLLERDFLEGIIAGLDPLSEAHAAHRGAERDAAAAQRGAELLAVALDQRRTLELSNVDRLRGEHDLAQARAASRSTERDAARAMHNEVRLQRLKLELAEAESEKERSQGRLDAAELELSGWQLMNALDDLERAVATASQLAAQVAAADEDAAPALARRDETAGRLLAKYHAEASASDREAVDHDKQAAAAKRAAEEADQDRTEALGDAAAAVERHRAARLSVEKAADRLTAEAIAGLVPAGTTPAQVRGLAEMAGESHTEHVTKLHSLKSATVTAAARSKSTSGAVREADKAFVAAARASEDSARDVRSVEDEGNRVAHLTAIREASGERRDGDSADLGGVSRADLEAPAALSVDELDEAADRLLDQLDRDIVDHTEHLDGLRAAQREDRRVVEALGTGGLLPPRPEVDRALAVLDDAGIVAYPGWRYLHETVAADERPGLIAAQPALADGIVLVDAGQMTSARQALEAARLLPAAAVAVGAGATLLELAGSVATGHADAADPSGLEPEGVYVVEPTPALFDEDAAAERREELATQMARRGAEIQAGAAQLNLVSDARNDLQRWRRANPPGHLARLRETAATTSEREAAALKHLEASRVELEEAAAALEEAEAAVEQGRIDERNAADRAVKLESLAELVESATEAQRLIPELATEVDQHRRVAEDALDHRRRAESAQSDHAVRAEQARAQAQRHRAVCAEVPSTDGRLADMVPQEALAELQAAAAAAHQVYLAAEVDPDLREQADVAAGKVKSLRSELDLRDPSHVAEAKRLRASPAGADRTSWSVGADNARRVVTNVRGEVQGLVERAGRLDEAVQNASPTEPGRRSWTNLSERWQPTTPEHGRSLEVEAQAEYRQAQIRLDEATAVVGDVERQRSQAEEARRGVHEALLPLAGVLGGVPDAVTAEPYAGDETAAQAAADHAVEALRRTGKEVERTRGELDGAAQELVAYANQGRYESLATQARRSILESNQATLAARAADWSTSLQARLATLASDLENVNRHRKAIVDRLSALAVQAVKTLRQASRLSRLPDDLAEWGGRPFLRIMFAEPDQTSVSVRVGEVVDRVAGGYAARASSGKSRNARRDGMSLLLDAVHASVPKGFTVDVLKPDSVLRDERAPIEEMNDVFSGGQELTAAIVLYCTLAALSANERGQMRSRHSGVLFLDNPIGRANAGYLIDLQQSVARSLGVQLIYTTGITDDRVLAAFPLWVRLRNDADLRAGLKYIQVAETVRRHLPASYAEDEFGPGGETSAGTGSGSGDQSAPGTVTATRVHRRPTAPAAHPRAASRGPSGRRASRGLEVQEPELREPDVREPVVREPVVREPDVPEPGVPEPVQ